MSAPPMLAPRPGRHFTWSEFCKSDHASGPELLEALYCDPDSQVGIIALCAAVLDPLRDYLGPINVGSGYRTRAVNLAIDGSKTSDHLRGRAGDIVLINAHSADRIMRAVKHLGISVDQAIGYDIERGGHAHLGYRISGNRGQMLWAPKAGGYLAWNG